MGDLRIVSGRDSFRRLGRVQGNHKGCPVQGAVRPGEEGSRKRGSSEAGRQRPWGEDHLAEDGTLASENIRTPETPRENKSPYFLLSELLASCLSPTLAKSKWKPHRLVSMDTSGSRWREG